jgi:hypothetical protein
MSASDVVLLRNRWRRRTFRLVWNLSVNRRVDARLDTVSALLLRSRQRRRLMRARKQSHGGQLSGFVFRLPILDQEG